MPHICTCVLCECISSGQTADVRWLPLHLHRRRSGSSRAAAGRRCGAGGAWGGPGLRRLAGAAAAHGAVHRLRRLRGRGAPTSNSCSYPRSRGVGVPADMSPCRPVLCARLCTPHWARVKLAHLAHWAYCQKRSAHALPGGCPAGEAGAPGGRLGGWRPAAGAVQPGGRPQCRHDLLRLLPGGGRQTLPQLRPGDTSAAGSKSPCGSGARFRPRHAAQEA